MKGDFSSWRFDPRRNHQGVLHQQGRVTLDADLTEGELIDLHWRTQAGRDVIGAGVAAVPAGDSGGFAITAAKVAGDAVALTVAPGRAWIDGVLAYLPGDAPVPRTATYLAPPINPAGTTTASIGDGVRDAVVLELVLEELNAFQDTALLEPALGGPDTTERVVPRLRFGLVRLGAGEDCTSIAGRLRDTSAGKGRLTVTLEPPEVVAGECPTVAGGGYSGFEHQLYRVEIAETNAGPPRFKWSRWNGGLVGRGTFTAGPPRTVTITANRSAILTCGLTEFYLEALAWDDAAGHWRVTCGTTATLDANQDLVLADPPTFGAFAFGADPVFFRLWDGIANVSAYTNAADPVELRDGIRLTFDPPAGATYRPGDYWTFAVRAGEIANDETLIDAQPPAGPTIRRVPLAEIEWTARGDTALGGAIEDCRRRFRPLVNQKTCCTFLVGDGVRSFGDFDSLEEAARHLPPAGGELCLLPGIHFANLVLERRTNVRIKGCPRRTFVLPRPNAPDQPIIRIRDGLGIHVAELELLSAFGPAIVADATRDGALREVSVHDCRAIARGYALRLRGVTDCTVARNRLWLLDTEDGRATIQLRATGALVERNDLGVLPFEETRQGDDPNGGGDRPDPSDPCAKPNAIYRDVDGFLGIARRAWTRASRLTPKQPYRAWGGIHLLGGCEEVRLLENHVDGGAGHGITLGGLLPGEAAGDDGGDDQRPDAPTITLGDAAFFGYVIDEKKKSVSGIDVFLRRNGALAGQDTSGTQGEVTIKAAPGPYQLSVEPGWELVSVAESQWEGGRFFVLTVRQAPVRIPEEQAFLYRLAIERNEVERMALSGIGFRRFADVPATLPPIDPNDPNAAAQALAALLAPRELLGSCNVVRDLEVRGNRLHHNVRVLFDDALRRDARTVAQGGISLALVEDATIADNEVLDNGRSGRDPVCGIFVGYGENVEISGNLVAGNGPVPGPNDGDLTEGLRGGVFVRFASAFLLGGAADAQQKPALRILGNRVDQPVGRAITAFAFGPVACQDNYLNSERTGRWSLFDTLVGGVLIVNLGGIQRQTRAPAQKAGFVNRIDAGGMKAGTGIATGTARAAELLLPGGELLYDDNQLRLGPDHRSAMATMLVTLDDLGCGGNQSTVLRPDLLFTNALCWGFSVRATSNRFRERAERCFFSLVTVAQGLTVPARLLTMNTTAHNQGDHCIVALTNAPPTGLPVVDDGNLEGNRAQCRERLGDPQRARAVVTQALLTVLLAERREYDVGTIATGSKLATDQAVRSVQGAATDYRYAQQVEARRLEQRYGADDPRTLQARERVVRTADGIRQLAVERELASITEAAVPERGTLVDGRVTDERASGRPNVTVELARADGTALGLSARTDDAGYFALPLDEKQVARLAQEKAYVQVRDEQGRVLQRASEPVAVQVGQPVRASVALPPRRVPPSVIVGTPPNEGGDRPPTSTPLEQVKGIGPKTAERLRAAGIRDVETLLRTPGAKLVELAGFDADVVRRHAEEALRGDAPSEPPPRPKRRKES